MIYLPALGGLACIVLAAFLAAPALGLLALGCVLLLVYLAIVNTGTVGGPGGGH